MSTTPNGPDPNAADDFGAGARRYGEAGEQPVSGSDDPRGEGLGDGREAPTSGSEDLRRAEAGDGREVPTGGSEDLRRADLGEGGATEYDETRHAGTGRAGPTGAEEWRGPVDEGSVRYGELLGDIPVSGSEESWSARPHPGFQPRPAGPGASKRLAAGALVGGVLLAVGVWGVYALLTAKSPNGNGAAPWTAAVTNQGAVVQGINAQNNVGPNAAALGEAGQQVRNALVACDAAVGDRTKLTSTTGTVGSLGAWSAQANPTISGLKGGSANLSTALNAGDIAATATAAEGLCATLATVNALPAHSDAVASTAWSNAVSGYADAATHALKGTSGDQSAVVRAKIDLAHADTNLNTVTARIAVTP